MRPHTISYLNHRKITVIDGTIGYIGGMTIGIAIAWRSNSKMILSAPAVQCTPFDVAEYKQRNIAVRFRDSLTRPLSPLL